MVSTVEYQTFRCARWEVLLKVPLVLWDYVRSWYPLSEILGKGDTEDLLTNQFLFSAVCCVSTYTESYICI